VAAPPGSASIQFHRDRFPGRPVFDTAVSHAMLRRVAGGSVPESLRLYRPENVMLFSSLDAHRPGFARAVECAHEAGFGAVMRLAGGHAAAFVEESMAFAWAIPDPDARLRIHSRFERLANLVVTALRDLGLDARVGQVPGEYCPGEYSVNLGGRVKVMGVGQRVVRGGAHVGGVLTVAQSESMRNALVRVYEALELEFEPGSAGGIADFEPGLGVEDVVASMRSALEVQGVALSPALLDAATLDSAEGLVGMHEPQRPQAAAAGSFRSLDGKTLLHADRLASDSDSDSSSDSGEGEEQ
jgi:octanoyl-[GcvH]:protein N-octanoyltransferase